MQVQMVSLRQSIAEELEASVLCDLKAQPHWQGQSQAVITPEMQSSRSAKASL